jgi:hypothetical protein
MSQIKKNTYNLNNTYNFDGLSIFRDLDLKNKNLVFKKFIQNLSRQRKMFKKREELKSSTRNTTKSLTKRYISYLTRHGKKIKTSLYLYKGLLEFFKVIFFQNYKINDYGEFVSDLKPTNPSSLENLLNYFDELLRPIFFLKIKKVDKRYKKKLKKKFVSHIAYIKPNKRLNLTLFALSFNIKIYEEQSIKSRIAKSFLELVLEDKNSYLYKRKLYMYSKILKKYKKIE